MRSLVLVLALAAAACGQNPQGYSQVEQVAFTQSCQTSARNAAGPNASQATLSSYCSCVWGHISTELPHRDFAAFSQLPENQRLSSPTGQTLAGYARTCLGTAAPAPASSTEPPPKGT